MTRRKLLALSVAAPLALASVLAVAVSCGSGSEEKPKPQPGPNPGDQETVGTDPANYKQKQRITEEAWATHFKAVADRKNSKLRSVLSSQDNNRRRTLNLRTFSEFENIAYDNDISTSYGSGTSGSNTQLTGEAWYRTARRGETVIEKRNETGPTGTVTKYVVTQPSEEWFQLNLASEVLITYWDGTEKRYTNSKHEIRPKWNQKSNYVVLESEDAESVNNPQFNKDLAQAKTVQFITREGVKWTNHDNTPSKYNVKSEDFYYSWMRTQLYDFAFRRQNGGVVENTSTDPAKPNWVDSFGKELDTKLSISNNRFKSNNEFPNGYLFSLFGVNLGALNDRAKTLQTVKDKSGKDVVAFTFSASSQLFEQNKNKTSGFSLAQFPNLIKLLNNDQTFYPAPSEYIKENVENAAAKIPDGASYTSLANVTGLAKEFGFYWYGYNSESSLFSGAYIPTSYNKTTRVEEFKFNKGYWNTQWVNSKNKIEKIQVSYKQPSETEESFNKAVYGGFKTGIVDTISYSTLSKEQKEAVDKGDSAYPVEYIIPLNKTQSTYRVVENLNPKVETDTNKAYEFNEQYSKLVYGASISELRTESTVTSMASVGDGAIFRSLYLNAINMKAFIDHLSNEEHDFWLTGSATDARFTTSTTLTPRDFKNALNSVFVLGADGNKINFAEAGQPVKNLITPDDLARSINEQTLEGKLTSPYFTKLQAEMKKLLDRVYTANNWQPTDKVQWNLGPYLVGLPENHVEAWNLITAIINKLDSRLEVKFVNPKKASDVYTLNARQRGAKQFAGWGYDYEGFGSYLTGVAAPSGGGILTVASAILSSSTEVQNKYPALLDLAKYFENKLSSDVNAEYFLPFKFREISKIPNIVFSKGVDYTLLTLENGKVRELDKSVPADKTLLEARASVTSFDTSYAKLFLSFQETKTPEQLVALEQEYLSLTGFSFSHRLATSKKAIQNIVNKKYVTPNADSSISYYQDIYVVTNGTN